MSYQFSYDELADPTDKDVANEWQNQDSIVFVLDGTQQMYESKCMNECLEALKEIVRNKCSYNKKDKIGVVIFGTKDTNCNFENVMLLQKFEPVTVDTLKNIYNILEIDIKKYKELALDSNEKYPLYDALDYAHQLANSSKTSYNSKKIIILCTSKDDPPVDARRRIEHLVTSFKDTNTELCVIGLTDTYNDNIFYKDLQIMSRRSSNENYQRMSLKDLEQNVMYPARSIARLPWKISPDITLKVSLYNLISAPKYPLKKKLNKSTNEILEGCTVMKEDNAEDSILNDSEEPVGDGNRVLTKDNIIYYKTFANLDIFFKPDERKKLKNAGLEPSIEILAFKPIMYDPIYHCKNTYFVSVVQDANEASRNFYRALVNRCIAKDLMPVCKVITTNTILICNMLPCENDGGFYMYTIPYNNYVRDFGDLLEAYRFDEDKSPIIEDAMYLFKKLMKIMKVDYTPQKFINPKLERCISHLEALALDNILSDIPDDNTRPPPVPEELRTVKNALMTILELQDIESAQKRPAPRESIFSKRSKMEVDIPTAARNDQLNLLTVAELRGYLVSVEEPANGTKAVLMEKIKRHLGLL